MAFKKFSQHQKRRVKAGALGLPTDAELCQVTRGSSSYRAEVWVSALHPMLGVAGKLDGPASPLEGLSSRFQGPVRVQRDDARLRVIYKTHLILRRPHRSREQTLLGEGEIQSVMFSEAFQTRGQQQLLRGSLSSLSQESRTSGEAGVV